MRTTAGLRCEAWCREYFEINSEPHPEGWKMLPIEVSFGKALRVYKSELLITGYGLLSERYFRRVFRQADSAVRFAKAL